MITYETARARSSLILAIPCSRVQFGTIHAWARTVSAAKRFWRSPGVVSLCLTKERYCLCTCTLSTHFTSFHLYRTVLRCLSRHVRYLYMTVPTDIEMQNEKRDLDFVDPYAIARTQADYVDILGGDWAFVSSRLLESKHFFNNENTKFQNLLYRFT